MRQTISFIALNLFMNTIFAQNDKVGGDKVNGDKVMGNKITIYQTIRKLEPSKTLALEILDQTIKIRKALSTESKQTIDTIYNYYVSSEKVLTYWSAPNEFALQQIISLAEINPTKTIKSLIPLLCDQNVTVSSGAVISLANIISQTKDDKRKKLLINLIPKEKSRSFVTNLSGASVQNYDFTPLKGTDVFYEANITGADFSHCKLDSLNFQHTEGEFSIFRQSSLVSANFELANLRGANFFGVFAPQVSFRMSILSYSDFGNIGVTQFPSKRRPIKSPGYFMSANLQGADFGFGQLDQTNFRGANLGFTKFEGAYLTEVNYYDSFLGQDKISVTREYIESQHPTRLDQCKF